MSTDRNEDSTALFAFGKKNENADNAFVSGCDNICHLSSGGDVTHLGLELKKKR